MGVEKMSVSFDLDLGEAIRTAAGRAGQSVSAWLGEAARDRIRLEALGTAIAAWEQKYGALTDAEVAAAETALEEAERKRRSGAA